MQYITLRALIFGLYIAFLSCFSYASSNSELIAARYFYPAAVERTDLNYRDRLHIQIDPEVYTHPLLSLQAWSDMANTLEQAQHSPTSQQALRRAFGLSSSLNLNRLASLLGLNSDMRNIANNWIYDFEHLQITALDLISYRQMNQGIFSVLNTHLTQMADAASLTQEGDMLQDTLAVFDRIQYLAEGRKHQIDLAIENINRFSAELSQLEARYQLNFDLFMRSLSPEQDNLFYILALEFACQDRTKILDLEQQDQLAAIHFCSLSDAGKLNTQIKQLKQQIARIQLLWQQVSANSKDIQTLAADTSAQEYADIMLLMLSIIEERWKEVSQLSANLMHNSYNVLPVAMP